MVWLVGLTVSVCLRKNRNRVSPVLTREPTNLYTRLAEIQYSSYTTPLWLENFQVHEIFHAKALFVVQGSEGAFKLPVFWIFSCEADKLLHFFRFLHENSSIHLMGFNAFEMLLNARLALIKAIENNGGSVMWLRKALITSVDNTVDLWQFSFVCQKSTFSEGDFLIHFHFSVVLLICRLENRYIGYCTTVSSRDMADVVFI